MRVHLHTICWNERRMLDFFFRHYAPWVDRFFILDDSSDDGSRDYLERRPDVEVGTLTRCDPDSWVNSAKAIYDTQWKLSRGAADWVVVANIDEHLHHPDMKAYLERLFQAGVTAVPALGYQMVADDFPPPDCLLWRDRPMGAPWRNMSRLAIFRPDQIQATNFGPGRHSAEFVGNVVLPDRDDAINLHYKYLGLATTQTRHESQAKRMGTTDRHNRWGHKYDWPIETLAADFEKYRKAAVDTSRLDHHRTHPEPRWWRPAVAEAEPA